MPQLTHKQVINQPSFSAALQGLLNEVNMSLDQLMEYDPKTGGLKPWAW
jgi:hypothetical protein